MDANKIRECRITISKLPLSLPESRWLRGCFLDFIDALLDDELQFKKEVGNPAEEPSLPENVRMLPRVESIRAGNPDVVIQEGNGNTESSLSKTANEFLNKLEAGADSLLGTGVPVSETKVEILEKGDPRTNPAYRKSGSESGSESDSEETS